MLRCVNYPAMTIPFLRATLSTSPGPYTMKLRILLADDHKMFREALRMMLDSTPEFEVVAEVGDGREVLARARQTLPDVVCMDVNMPGLNGIEATRGLVAAQPGVKIIALSANVDQNSVTQMLDAGALAYVGKTGDGSELVRAIHAVRHNKTYLCPDVSAGMVNALRGGAKGFGESTNLGRRERQVLQLLAEGKTSPEIATCLHIAASTVEVHRRNIMRKLDIHSVAELTKYAIRAGLTSV